MTDMTPFAFWGAQVRRLPATATARTCGALLALLTLTALANQAAPAASPSDHPFRTVGPPAGQSAATALAGPWQVRAAKPQPTATLSTAATSSAGQAAGSAAPHLVIDIDPNLPQRANWSFTLQRKVNGHWVPAGKYRSAGTYETADLAVPAGTNRVRVAKRSGFVAATSQPYAFPATIQPAQGAGGSGPAATAPVDPAPAGSPAAGFTTVAGPDRNTVLASWASYQQQDQVAAGWSGDRATCTAGDTDLAYKQATIGRVNWYRRMVGLGEVTLDVATSTAAQQTAMMMAAAGSLSHHPDGAWPCYTEVGATLSGRSNLYLGSGWSVASGPTAVNGYMDDPGDNNLVVGHRRWLLYPAVASMATGDVVEPPAGGVGGNVVASNALVVLGNFATPAASPALIAWPNAGYTPRGVVPTSGRWSLSIPSGSTGAPARNLSADFSAATVSVTGPAGPVVATTVSHSDFGYGDSTLVWQMPDLGLHGGMADATYTVTVSGVQVRGEVRAYRYSVTIIDLA